jgi:hypothetical protein
MSARLDFETPGRWVPRQGKRLVVLLVLVPILMIAAATIRPPALFCDGVVAPVWAGDPCGGGYVPTLLEYVWPPEHWFAPSQCYGLCRDSLEL